MPGRLRVLAQVLQEQLRARLRSDEMRSGKPTVSRSTGTDSEKSFF